MPPRLAKPSLLVSCRALLDSSLSFAPGSLSFVPLYHLVVSLSFVPSYLKKKKERKKRKKATSSRSVAAAQFPSAASVHSPHPPNCDGAELPPIILLCSSCCAVLLPPSPSLQILLSYHRLTPHTHSLSFLLVCVLQGVPPPPH